MNWTTVKELSDVPIGVRLLCQVKLQGEWEKDFEYSVKLFEMEFNNTFQNVLDEWGHDDRKEIIRFIEIDELIK